MSDRDVSIRVLVENSSLGTVHAGTLRACVPEAVMRRILVRVQQIRDTPCPTCGGNPNRPDETHIGMCHAGWARDRVVEGGRLVCMACGRDYGHEGQDECDREIVGSRG